MSVLKVNHLYLILDYPTKSLQSNLYNTCLKYFNVESCQKPCWNQDMLRQRPVRHPQNMLHDHKRKLDWLSLFIIDKSFRAIICHLSAPYRYFVYLCQISSTVWDFSFGGQKEVNSVEVATPCQLTL